MAEKTPTFPKRFLWGAATAAHQVEGNTHNQWAEWELENAKTKAAQAEFHFHDMPSWSRIKTAAKDPSNYVSGELADHYNRYEEDFAFLEKMHMNAYRFSIEWSRVEPTEGSWDASAVTHYKEYIAALKARGIEPIVTLFHFTLPVWFSQMGGFEKRANVQYFVRFSEKIMRELGNGVKYIITINEPEVYAHHSYYIQEWPPAQASAWKFYRVTQNLAYAHRQTAKALKAINQRYKISFAKNSSFYYPGDTAWLSRVSSQVLQYFSDDFFLKKYVKHSDFIAVNYYFTNRVYGYRVHNPDERLSDLHWDLQPADVQHVLERLTRKYKKPLFITENGLADAEDAHREWWIKETIVAMQKAMANDVELLGYLHWSLIDNFEWAYGKWPRFGLVDIDYKTGQRTLRPSAAWFGRVIKKLRGV